jgi:PIN domain nuclease of toxin-antitoxin system
MNLLLDTHVFMWWNSEPERIPTDTLRLLQDPNHNLFLSLVSLWEMQIKIQLGKLTLREDLEIMVQYEQERNNLSLMAIKLPHILKLKDLPHYHKDPFDRLLIAQSQLENATLVSRDSAFQNYDCSVIWS